MQDIAAGFQQMTSQKAEEYLNWARKTYDDETLDAPTAEELTVSIETRAVKIVSRYEWVRNSESGKLELYDTKSKSVVQKDVKTALMRTVTKKPR